MVSIATLINRSNGVRILRVIDTSACHLWCALQYVYVISSLATNIISEIVDSTARKWAVLETVVSGFPVAAQG